MLIWSGRGLIVVVIGAIAIFGGVIVGEALKLGNAGDGVLAGLAMIPAGLVIWRLGKRWNGPGRVLVDPATGEQVVLKRGDSLFFVPFEWWGPIFGVLGVLFAVASLMGPR